MKLGSVQAPDGMTNCLLADLAARAMARGLRVLGAVQSNIDRPGQRRCDMELSVLPEGPVLQISQHLGEGARGCRLNPASLEEAVRLTEAAVAQGADLLVINKFGKHEAEGRGFRAVIAEALSRDIAVIVGLNALNAEAFAAFCDGAAEALAPTPEALDDWLARACDKTLAAQ